MILGLKQRETVRAAVGGKGRKTLILYSIAETVRVLERVGDQIFFSASP